MRRLEKLSSMIEQIYSAALDPTMWPGALRSIEEVTGSVGAVINFIPKGSANPWTIAGRFTDEQCRTYSTEYQHLCRRIAYSRDHPSLHAHYDRLVLSEAEMDRDPVYAWLASHGLRYYVGGDLCATRDHFVYASLQRSPGQGHVEVADIHAFDLVRSHLKQALTLADQFGTLDRLYSLNAAYLDRLPQGVIMVGKGARILFANARAESLLAKKNCIVRSAGSLAAMHQDVRESFSRMLAKTLLERQGGSIALPLVDDGPSLIAFATPIPNHNGQLEFGDTLAVVVVHDPLSRPEIDPSLLRNLYGLTEAEARIACWVGTGSASGQTQRSIGISRETFKSHLKAIYGKMSIHSRSQLVRIVTGLGGLGTNPPNGG